MRDDLHKTVPLPRQWSTVLRYAARKPDWDRVPEDIVNAVKRDFSSAVDPKWFESFSAALRNQTSDLFGKDTVTDSLAAIERPQMSSLERDLCETAHGLHARGTPASQLLQKSVTEVQSLLLERQIEHVAAQVYQQHGMHQAGAVRKRLQQLAKTCDFSKEPQRRRRQKGGLELLDAVVSKGARQ